jgi:peptidoglycan hydrolase-like protein with peptidoglycan-binding domain
MYKNATLAIFALTIFFSANTALAALSCTVSTTCNSPDVVVFRMASTSNSHAELPSQSNYSQLVCCSGVTGLSNSCSGSYSVVARLSADTNAHIEEGTQSTSAYDGHNACLSVPSGSTVSIGYQNTNCDGFDTTIASMATATTNSHVGDSSTYTRKICASISATRGGNSGLGGTPPPPLPTPTPQTPTPTTPTPTTPSTPPSRIYNFGTTTLKLGSRGEAVKELQRFLNDKLNLGLIVDGIFGPKTVTIVKKWQSDHGLVPDGLVGAKTKAMMNGFAVPPTPSAKRIYNFGTTTLKLGSRGEAVKELQRFLNDKLNLGLDIDGILGPKTIEVIKKWQKDHGLVPDGLVGAKTKAMMNSQ